jgi:ATP-dependent protease HslVU (ClpYQ) peptidase subunit
MTVIAAIKTDNKIVFARDSLMTADNTIITDNNTLVSKLWQQNDLTVGHSGQCLFNTLMRIFAKTHVPKSACEDGMIEFLIEYVNLCQSKYNVGMPTSQFLIAFQDQLFRVYGGIDVYKVENFDAIGSGGDFAQAALLLGKTAKEAAEVSCKLSSTCALPVRIVEHFYNK